MNDEIKYLYGGLDQFTKDNIQIIFEQSPKMLLYLNLLQQDQVINTNKAVNHIYLEELKTVSRNILINRFYKLRSKLRLWLLTQMKNSSSCLTPEEQELFFLRLMVLNNEHTYAIDRLSALEEKFWENNIFELLPELINLLLRSMRACGSFTAAQQMVYIEKLEIAIDLNRTLQLFNCRIEYLHHNIEDYSVILDAIRRKVKKLKRYPRFALLYHFIAFSAGIYREDIVKKMSNAMSRHLNQFNQLKAQYPRIPISDFEPYHREKMEIMFCIKEATYWYYKQQPLKSYAVIKKRAELIEQATGFYPKQSDSELHNLIYYCLNAEKHEDALIYINQLKEFQLVNFSDQIDNPYFNYLMIAYIGLFPNKEHPQPQELIQQVGKFLKHAGKESAWAYGTLAEFCIIYGYFEEAKKALDNPELTAYYEQYEIKIQTKNLLTVVQKEDPKAIEELCDLLTTLYKESPSSKYQFHYKGHLKIAAYFLEKFQ